MRRLLAALLVAGCTASPPPPEPVVVPSTTPTPVAIEGPRDLPADLPQTEAAPAPKDLQVPVYPGAKALGGGQLKLKGKLDSYLSTLDYQTPDSVAKVVTWYRGKLPKAKQSRIQEPGYELVTLQDEVAQITISRSGAQGPTLVNLVRQAAPAGIPKTP